MSTASRTRIGNRWNTLKYLDKDTKLDLITLLSESLKASSKQEPVSASKYYGIWGDDGMSAEEFVDSIKSDRRFKQDIVDL